MHPSPDSPTAVVLLPPVRGRLGDRTLSRWLSQGRLQEVPAPVDPFTQILGELGQERPPEGLAALRMWGQTGDRPGSWIAGADPVYMEPRLDRLFLHVLGPGDASRSELRRVFDGLQDTLGADDKIGFARLGGYGYIRAAQPMLTPEVPATVLDGQSPGDSLRPMGVAADTLKLISEIEMTLHEMPVNEERRSRGQAPPQIHSELTGAAYGSCATAIRRRPVVVRLLVERRRNRRGLARHHQRMSGRGSGGLHCRGTGRSPRRRRVVRRPARTARRVAIGEAGPCDSHIGRRYTRDAEAI